MLAAGGDAVAKSRHKRAKKPRPAPTASSDTEGRGHLKKGKVLASHGDCKAAVEELTKAFDILNDPEVLLARADCFQRLGLADEAVGDYRAYLDESPDVANRSEIEKPHGEAAVAPAAKEKPHGEAAVGPAARPAPPVASPAPPPANAAPPPPQIPAAAPPAIVEIEVGEAPTQAAKPPARPAAEAPRRWWLWTTLAVLVAGGAVAGGYFYFRPSDPMTTGTLGSYHF
jgi:hypothetical protein